nr:hypothetical protein - Arabidopsis thaliana [Arabidopsis thaliana]
MSLNSKMLILAFEAAYEAKVWFLGQSPVLKYLYLEDIFSIERSYGTYNFTATSGKYIALIIYSSFGFLQVKLQEKRANLIGCGGQKVFYLKPVMESRDLFPPDCLISPTKTCSNAEDEPDVPPRPYRSNQRLVNILLNSK